MDGGEGRGVLGDVRIVVAGCVGTVLWGIVWLFERRFGDVL